MLHPSSFFFQVLGTFKLYQVLYHWLLVCYRAMMGLDNDLDPGIDVCGKFEHVDYLPLTTASVSYSSQGRETR